MTLDLDLEEVNLKGGINNLMNEIDDLNILENEKEAELKQIKATRFRSIII